MKSKTEIANIFGVIIGAIFVSIIFTSIIGVFVWLLWNWLMPVIFGLPVINIFQAIGLTFLSDFLFKSRVQKVNNQ
jgi:hypothetical protein